MCLIKAGTILDWGEICGGHTLTQWNEIKEIFSQMEMKEEKDSFVWSLAVDGKYTASPL